MEWWRGGVMEWWRVEGWRIGGVEWCSGGEVEWGMGRDRTRIVVSSGCGLATRHRVVCTIGRLLPRPVRFLKYGSPTTDTMRRYPVRSTAEANQRPLLAERPLASCCCR